MAGSVQWWVLQANPQIYDIDAALLERSFIDWRVPQHTSQVEVGDRVLIWRSGDDAGFVGVGVIAGEPRESIPGAEDMVFYAEGHEVEGDTRVRVVLAPVEFAPKSELLVLPEFREHRLLTAPLGTSVEQVAALHRRFPQLRKEVEQADTNDNAWPSPFAWKQRRKSLQMLPGDSVSLPETLRRLLARVGDDVPARDYFEGWIVNEYDVGSTNAQFITDQLERLSLVRKVEGSLELTANGRRYVESQDKAFLVALLHSRVQLIGELLQFARKPRSDEEFWRLAVDEYGMKWTTGAQPRRRRMWLEAFGALEQDDTGRYRTTAMGEELLAIIDSEAGQPADAAHVVAQRRSEPPEDRVQEAPRAASWQHIVGELQESSRDTSNPDRFEQATAEAFRALGFRATWIGGPGKTDVLLDAPLGAGSAYRVIVDCKTTSRGTIPPHQVDFETLREHKEQHQADYVCLVGPEFSGQRLFHRAANHDVAVIDVDLLASLLRQHSTAPLGLHSYKALFDRASAEEAGSFLAEESATAERWAVLVAAVLHAFAEEQEQAPDGLGSRDLFWILQGDPDDGPGYSRDEIAQALSFLETPVLQALTGPHDGQVLAGLPRWVSARLRSVADAIDSWGPEEA